MSTLLLRTSVRKQTQKYAVIKGTILAMIALCSLWIIEIILPLLGLESLGGWAWFLRGALASTGFVPYQKVSWQKNHPDVLKVDEDQIVLCKGEKAVFSIPWDKISHFTFLDRGSVYGLAFTLKSSKVVLEMFKDEEKKDPLTHSFLLSSLEELGKSDNKKPNSPYTAQLPPKVILQKSRKKYGVDVFLPYFTEHSHLMLKQWYAQSIDQEISEQELSSSSRI